jgi:transcriptional regulator with XRE-family HTH domain
MAIGPDEKVDWFRVIVELCNAHGYTHSTIATAVGLSKSSVQNWKHGATPKYEEGDRLIELWARVTGKSQETVHRVKRYSYRA